jgi:hypothetical protein
MTPPKRVIFHTFRRVSQAPSRKLELRGTVMRRTSDGSCTCAAGKSRGRPQRNTHPPPDKAPSRNKKGFRTEAFLHCAAGSCEPADCHINYLALSALPSFAGLAGATSRSYCSTYGRP